MHSRAGVAEAALNVDLTSSANASLNAEITRPLAGVPVRAVENFVAAPVAPKWLADAGTEVVVAKILGLAMGSRLRETQRPA